MKSLAENYIVPSRIPCQCFALTTGYRVVVVSVPGKRSPGLEDRGG